MTGTDLIPMPLNYLDKALTKLRDLGLMPEKPDETPVVAMIQKVSDLDEEKAIAIARTLNHTTVFNEVVREQVAAMEVGAGLPQRGRRDRDVCPGRGARPRPLEPLADSPPPSGRDPVGWVSRGAAARRGARRSGSRTRASPRGGAGRAAWWHRGSGRLGALDGEIR